MRDLRLLAAILVLISLTIACGGDSGDQRAGAPSPSTPTIALPTPALVSPTAMPTVVPTATARLTPTARPSPTPPPTETPTETPMIPPTPTTVTSADVAIVFAAEINGWDHKLYAIDADGSNLHQIVTTGRGRDSLFNMVVDGYPAWSPDGTRIAYLSGVLSLDAEDGLDDDGLYVVNLDGSGEHRLLDGFVTEIAWSPDGSQLVCTLGTWLGDASDIMKWDVWLVNVDGSGARQLTDDLSIEFYPSWSPDGTRLVWGTADIETGRIYFDVVTLDGTRHARIDPSPVVVSGVPGWSPDGAWLAFAGGDVETLSTDPPAVYLVRPDGSELHAIANPLLTGGAVEWSPDGSQLAFSAFVDMSGEVVDVFVVNVDGSGLRAAASSPESDETGATWSPDGTRLLAFAVAQDVEKPLYDLVVIDVAAGTTTTIATGLGSNMLAPARWRPVAP